MPKKAVKSAKSSKSSKVAQEKQNRQMRVTVYFGYGLFLLTAISLFVSITPWFGEFIGDSRNFVNMVMLLLTFIIAAILPPLIGYMVGDSSTRSKSNLIHHHNGVLFGLLGVWLYLLSDSLMYYIEVKINYSDMVYYYLMQLVPVAITVVALLVFAFYFAFKTRRQGALIDYPPFQALIIGVPLVLIANIVVSPYLFASINLDALLANVIPFGLVLLVLGLVGYWVLGKRTGTFIERLTFTFIAIGFSVVTAIVCAQFSAGIGWRQEAVLYVIAVLLGVWAAYLLLLRRATR